MKWIVYFCDVCNKVFAIPPNATSPIDRCPSCQAEVDRLAKSGGKKKADKKFNGRWLCRNCLKAVGRQMHTWISNGVTLYGRMVGNI